MMTNKKKTTCADRVIQVGNTSLAMARQLVLTPSKLDEKHPIDDCVTLCLGGRERYYNEQRKIAGTFFLTPGWSRHWRRMLETGSGEMSQPGLKRLLTDYQRALVVRSPVVPDKELQRRGEEFCRLTRLRLETQSGTLAPLIAAWNATKAALQPKSACNTAEGLR